MNVKSTTRILFLSASPTDLTRLGGVEYKEIKKALKKSNAGFELEPSPEVSLDEIKEYLYDFKPHIAHISAHGSKHGLIV